MITYPFLDLALALGLGLLVGLQRERERSRTAGIRTFALTTLAGGLMAVFPVIGGLPLILGGLAAITVLAAVSAWASSASTPQDPGLTTEVAMVVMYLVGALAGSGEHTLAVVLGAITAILLHLRPQLHGIAHRISDHDMRAIMQFVVVALVIFPLLPDTTFGPYDVINPRRMWLMVVLITGIGLGSYVAYQFLGGRAGSVVGGILGGLISSTATTVSYARRGRDGSPCAPGLAVMVILIAAAVVFARVLVLAAITAPQAFRTLAPPLAWMLIVTALLAGIAWWQSRRLPAAPAPATNPTELKMALTFAVLYGVILLAVAAAKQTFGTQGLFVVAVISGLTDMDAITLSTAQLAHQGEVDGTTAGKVILAAGLSNLVFKGGMVLTLGGRALAQPVLIAFGIALAAGLVWLGFR